MILETCSNLMSTRICMMFFLHEIPSTFLVHCLLVYIFIYLVFSVESLLVKGYNISDKLNMVSVKIIAPK